MNKDKDDKDWPCILAMLTLSVVCLVVINFLKTV